MKERFFVMATLYMHKFPNGKVYVGQTCHSVSERWRQEGKGYKGQPVYNAIVKYGWNNIEHIIISDDIEEDSIDAAERFFIALFDSANRKFGYNCEDGGNKNKHLSDSTKEKIRLAHEGTKVSLETVKKFKTTMAGRPEETKKEHYKKISDGLRNRTEEERAASEAKRQASLRNRTEEERAESEAKRQASLKNRTKKEKAETSKRKRNSMLGKNKGKNPYAGKTKEEMNEICKEKRALSLEHCKKIAQYDKNGVLIRIFDCAKDAGAELGRDSSSILKCCKNRPNYKTAHGYVWKYVEE